MPKEYDHEAFQHLKDQYEAVYELAMRGAEVALENRSITDLINVLTMAANTAMAKYNSIDQFNLDVATSQHEVRTGPLGGDEEVDGDDVPEL